MRKSGRRLLLLCALLLVLWLLYKGLFIRAFYLAFLEKSGLPATSSMVDALDDTSEPVRGVCVGYFTRLGAEGIRPLVEALGDREWRRREGAAMSLAAVALRHKDAQSRLKTEAHTALIHAMHDEDDRVRVWAAIALWRVERKPDEVVPSLISMWKEGIRSVRYRASEGLREIGPKARKAIPTLLESVNDKDPAVRSWAIDTLLQIDPEVAVKADVQ